MGGWITMATVLTNTQSVVTVEENTSADAKLMLTVPSKSSSRQTILKSSQVQILLSVSLMPMRFEEKLGFMCAVDFL